jgi:SH3 domain protein
MMRRIRTRVPGRALLLAILLGSASLAAQEQAEAVYVTDELRLGLYATEETTGRALKTLISGTRLQVLERSLMSIRVRTEDGDEGWVKTGYVVPNEPARRRLEALESLQATTAESLAASEADKERLSEQISGLEAELAQANQGIADLPEVMARNEALNAELTSRGIQVPLLWFALAVVGALIGGGIVGYWWLDRKVRRKFGGVRVY